MSASEGTAPVLFCIRHAVNTSQLPVQCVPGALYPEVKRKEREADHLPPATVDVNNLYKHSPPYAFMA
jgi:hypothetical protein